MEKYNRQDVTLLEELYAVLQPWIPNHPHRGLYDGHSGCRGLEAHSQLGLDCAHRHGPAGRRRRLLGRSAQNAWNNRRQTGD